MKKDKKYTLYDWYGLNEAGYNPNGRTKGPAQVEAPQTSIPPAENQSNSPSQTPEQAGDQQKAKGSKQNEPFRELTGQTIASVSFTPNGATGGIVSIKTKNSHLPFRISWVNSKVTIQDSSGNVINLSDNSQ